jgi:hypothetical protein
VREREWHAYTSPQELLGFLRQRHAVTATPAGRRKLLLFAAGCYRRFWPLLTDPRCRRLVEGLEGYADGLATRRELARAEGQAARAEEGLVPGPGWVRMVRAEGRDRRGEILSDRQVMLPYLPTGRRAPPSAWAAALTATLAPLAVEQWPGAQARELRWQAGLVRDLFWPFPPRPEVGPWLAWEGGLVRALAESAYRDRAFDRLPVVADALEDAGCQDEALLAHLRGPGPHAHGCGALELLRGG